LPAPNAFGFRAWTRGASSALPFAAVTYFLLLDLVVNNIKILHKTMMVKAVTCRTVSYLLLCDGFLTVFASHNSPSLYGLSDSMVRDFFETKPLTNVLKELLNIA
jgi:hypothetical protein